MSEPSSVQPRADVPPRRRAGWWWYVAAGLAHAALSALALPPLGLWFLAWLAPLPLALGALVREERAWRSGLIVGLATLPFWLYELTYINAMTGAGYVPLCVYLSLYPGLFCALLAVVRRRLPAVPLCVSFPLLWILTELLRCEVVLNGYPWFQLSQGLIESPALAAPARVGGQYLVSFLVAWVAGGVVDVLASRPRFVRGTIWFAAGVAVFAVLGARPGAPAGGRGLRAGLVQTNLPQDNKIGWTIEERVRDMERWSGLTRRVASMEPAPDVVVWPETMFPGFFLDDAATATLRENGVGMTARRADGSTERVTISGFSEKLAVLSLDVGVPMLVGGVGVENLRLERRDGGTALEFDSRFNSVFLVDHGRVTGERYDKMALTPFGEYMPLVGRWKWLQDRLLALGGRGMKFDLKPGRRPVVFEVPTGSGPARVVTPICFETAWATQCRELVGGGGTRRADVMACLTNDGWFADSDRGREQHLQAARWRCVELGTPMIRSANTGISAAIDPWGRVLRRGVDGDARGVRVDGVLSVFVSIPTGETTYLRHGDWFRWPALGAGALLALAGISQGIVGNRRRPAGERVVGAGAERQA